MTQAHPVTSSVLLCRLPATTLHPSKIIVIVNIHNTSTFASIPRKHTSLAMQNTANSFSHRVITSGVESCYTRVVHEVSTSFLDAYNLCIVSATECFNPAVVTDAITFDHLSLSAAWSCHSSIELLQWSVADYLTSSCYKEYRSDLTPSSFAGSSFTITVTSDLITTSDFIATPPATATSTSKTTSTLIEDVYPNTDLHTNTDICPVPDFCLITDTCPTPASMSTGDFTLTAEPMSTTVFRYIADSTQVYTSPPGPWSPGFSHSWSLFS
jgi:hypothetical protein